MFARSSIRLRLVALLLVPAAILLVMAGLQLRDALSVVSRTQDTELLTQVAAAERQLLNGLQLERTRSLETLAAEADGQPVGVVSDELAAARSAVTAAAAQVDATIADLQVDTLQPDVYRAHQIAQSRLRTLDAMRFNLEGGRTDSRSIISAFSRPIDALLEVDLAVITALGDSVVADQMKATYAVSRFKDAAFRSSDVLVLFASGSTDAATTTRLLSEAQAEQGTWLAVARTELDREEQAGLDAIVGEVPDAETLILAVNGSGDVDVMDMAATTTASAQSLRGLEDGFVADGVETAATARQDALVQAGVYGALAVVVLALLALLVLVLIRDVLGPLRALTRLATGVRQSLPETVERLARGEAAGDSVFDDAVGAGLTSRPDELGELARAIEASTEEATRVAAGHAATRAGITRTIEDVARREQTLVERQLSLLDRLEDIEDDPEQLAQLFKLDHLATRMRRNAENLLLLASGRLPGSHDAAPVALVDVARTAAAEIEQYGRVDVRVGVSDTLLGYAATPITHLLAELVENATQFSPPTTRVTVSARTLPEGVVVHITDHGLGMTDDQIVDARRKLAEPPLLEAAESRRLGMYVVGLIAQKLAITVDVRANDDDPGITVDVRLPRALFEGGEPETTAPPTAPAALAAPSAAPGVPSLPAVVEEQPEVEEPQPVAVEAPRAAMPDLETPPDALSVMGQLLDAELASPPDLPSDVLMGQSVDLPTRDGAPRPASDGTGEGRTLSLSTASGGRTVDINPDAISALMGGLSHPTDGATTGSAADDAASWLAAVEGFSQASPAPASAAPPEEPEVRQATASAPTDEASSAPEPTKPRGRRARDGRKGGRKDTARAASARPAPDGVASSWSTPFPPQGGSA